MHGISDGDDALAVCLVEQPVTDSPINTISANMLCGFVIMGDNPFIEVTITPIISKYR